MGNKLTICEDCGKICISDGFGTGYGRTAEGKNICYDCCGKRDREQMKNMKVGDKICLYLAHSEETGWHISNWPGTLQIKVYPKEGRHNIAGIRRDVWFDYGGNTYHGVSYGNNTEICHIQRIKG